MALIERATLVTFKMRDMKDTTTCQIHSGKGSVGALYASPGELFTFVQEFYDSLKNASDCAGLGFNILYSYDDDAAIAYGASPAVERKGVMTFQTADGFSSLFTIPGIKESAIASDGEHIRRDGTTFTGESPIGTHLQSIHDKIQNGATVGAVNYPTVDRRGADLNGLIDAYQQHRRNNRG